MQSGLSIGVLLSSPHLSAPKITDANRATTLAMTLKIRRLLTPDTSTSTPTTKLRNMRSSPPPLRSAS
ncbi:uncharacterized protein RCC_08960 [Ramularia collo-cygni]|uniref:Uncharacterized protein n=1 Tax=Ramularia collo-cygni TaxID=112498 RepID=A0A2D3VIZ1_9PEZI|nr:uncharacterized protein RCC_08960 [Ramularia collo-cygni]CZT23249.1 uncharacterized protein RCC_08960 [Ramularia collo-cygni]